MKRIVLEIDNDRIAWIDVYNDSRLRAWRFDARGFRDIHNFSCFPSNR